MIRADQRSWDLLRHLDTLPQQQYWLPVHAETLAAGQECEWQDVGLLLNPFLAAGWVEEHRGPRFRITPLGKLRLDEQNRVTGNRDMRASLLRLMADEYSRKRDAAYFDSGVMAAQLAVPPELVTMNLEIMEYLGHVEIKSRLSGAGHPSYGLVLTREGYQHFVAPSRHVVFLSHAASDKALAAYVKGQLETAYPALTVFASSDDILPGNDWEKEVLAHLKEAALMVVLATARGVRRHWVWLEMGAGWSSGLDVIPIRTSSSRDTGLPQPFTKFQYIDGDSAADILKLFGRIAMAFSLPSAQVDASTVAGRVAELDAEASQLERATAAADPIWTKLNELRDRVQLLRVKPTVPAVAQFDDFQIIDLSQEVVEVLNLNSHHTIQVPRSRIVEVLPANRPEFPTVLLKGRLQWITPTRIWKFEDERPSDDPHGFAKPSNDNDPRVREIQQALAGENDFSWCPEAKLPQVLSPTARIVYDTDGRYFRWRSTPDDRILVIKAKK